MHFNRGNLGLYKLGAVVVKEGANEGFEQSDVGHIIGFSKSIVNELLLKVNFAIAGEMLIHPNNVTVMD